MFHIHPAENVIKNLLTGRLKDDYVYDVPAGPLSLWVISSHSHSLPFTPIHSQSLPVTPNPSHS
jgi:hypothetical protein